MNEMLSKPCLTLYDFKKKREVKSRNKSTPKNTDVKNLKLFNIFEAVKKNEIEESCFMI